MMKSSDLMIIGGVMIVVCVGVGFLHEPANLLAFNAALGGLIFGRGLGMHQERQKDGKDIGDA